MKKIEVYIPVLPDKRLGPNRSRNQHWGTTTRLKNELKRAALGGVLEFLQEFRKSHGACWRPVRSADLRIIIFNGRRRMDDDNTIACLKAALDMAQGRIIENDAGFHITGVDWVRDNSRPKGICFEIYPKDD